MSTKNDKPESSGEDLHDTFMDIHYDDAVEFLSSKSTDLKCPMCSTSGWNLSVAEDDIMREFSIHLSGNNKKVYRMIMATCKNCGFASMHHVDVIYKWMIDRDKKAELEDDEEQ